MTGLTMARNPARWGRTKPASGLRLKKLDYFPRDLRSVLILAVLMALPPARVTGGPGAPTPAGFSLELRTTLGRHTIRLEELQRNINLARTVRERLSLQREIERAGLELELELLILQRDRAARLGLTSLAESIEACLQTRQDARLRFQDSERALRAPGR